MSSSDIDFVRIEKLAAMRRYTQQKKLKSFVFFVEIFVALAFLLFWYSTYYAPVLSDVAVDFLRRSVVVFGRSMYMFLLINVLVGVILFMSFQKPTKTDLYDDYVSASASVSSSATAAVTHSTDYKSESEMSTVTDRQLVRVENSENKETTTVGTAEETPAESVQTPRVLPESRKYIRTRSERCLKENRPELRRSGTVVRREKKQVEGGEGGEEQPRRALSAMDALSNEEFRSTIDTFIALNKKSLIRENTLDFIKLDRSRAVLSR